MNRSNRVMIYAFLYFLVGFITHMAVAEEAKTVRLSESEAAKILISTRGTVLSFPAKPTKVILGRNGSFGIEYVENDLAISPLSTASRSNLFVYVLGRRFAFDLVASSKEGTSVIQVRDTIIKDISQEKVKAKK